MSVNEYNQIRQKVRKIVAEKVLREQVRKVVAESVRYYYQNLLSETKDKKDNKSSYVSNKSSNTAKQTLTKLKQDKFNQAEFAYHLYPDIDPDSARSKLYQKIRGEKGWSTDELTKLDYLMKNNVRTK